MMAYVAMIAGWVASNVAALVAGGYICYRFRAQIDAVRARVEPMIAKMFGAIWK